MTGTDSDRLSTALSMLTSPERCPFDHNHTGTQQYRKSNCGNKGSRIRLSWPRSDDRRRAKVGKTTSIPGHHAPLIYDGRMIHVSYRDVEKHYQRTKSASNSFPLSPTLPRYLKWNPVKLEIGDAELLDYFQRKASRSLATFGHDSFHLGKLITRIALEEKDKAHASPVFQMLLAFSSLHRYDINSHAAELKISAIKALGAMSEAHFGDTRTAVQHLVAGMLLCSFEIFQSSCTSGHWTMYLSGVKEIISAASLYKLHQDADMVILFDWIYYHDVLAHFSMLYWHRSANWMLPSSRSEAFPETSPATASITLLSEVCDAVNDCSSSIISTQRVRDQKIFLEVLDWRIRKTLAISSDMQGTDNSMEALYKLAVLLYLHRSSDNLLNQASRMQQYINQAFIIISERRCCDWQFPVFILGCEAQSDEQRSLILDLITRTEQNGSSRSFNYVKLLLEAIWAQDDLADRAIKYSDKLTSAITNCSVMPIFV